MKHVTCSGLALLLALSSNALRAEPEPPPAAASTPTAAQRAKLCEGCAWVQQLHTETREGKASGLGVVGGAVLGGLLGHQVGGGTGKKIATVGGAVAGGYAGNEAEKHLKQRKVWIVQLLAKDGSTRRVELAEDPQLRVGDTVREQDGRLVRP
ncbi:MAG: glycine zipper 2TM domain-containing protein [Roseateles sp.]|nr:MAG: glycine zipper 2TM domain-containing protein [Roseateles sp.]